MNEENNLTIEITKQELNELHRKAQDAIEELETVAFAGEDPVDVLATGTRMGLAIARLNQISEFLEKKFVDAETQREKEALQHEELLAQLQKTRKTRSYKLEELQ
jgi:hypothetical protein